MAISISLDAIYPIFRNLQNPFGGDILQLLNVFLPRNYEQNNTYFCSKE